MDTYTAVLSVVFLAFCEVVAVCWIFGEILPDDQYFCVNVLLPQLIRASFQRCSQTLFDGKEDAGQNAKHLLSFLLDSALSSVDTGEAWSV